MAIAANGKRQIPVDLSQNTEISQTSRKCPSLGPGMGVRLQEVSAYEWLRNKNTIVGRV